MASIIDSLDMHEPEIILVADLGGVLHLTLQVGVVVACHPWHFLVTSDLHANRETDPSNDRSRRDHKCSQSMFLLKSLHINPLASTSKQHKIRVSFTFAHSLLAYWVLQ